MGEPKKLLLRSVALLLAAGCTVPPDDSPPPPSVRSADAAPSVRVRDLGTSVEGRPLRAFDVGHGEDCVLLIASIHGNEGLGTPLLERLLRHLREHPEHLEGRRVVLVPEANPDGLARGSRRNARGIDLNRNFPARNFRRGGGGDFPLSEPEARALCGLVRSIRPDRVVSIHQPLALVDYDGPGRELAAEMAAGTDLPVRRLGARPGSLGSWVGRDLGIPIVTVELPPHGGLVDVDALWSRFGEMLLAAVAYPAPATPEASGMLGRCSGASTSS
jgi:protein MpaA